MTMRAASLTLVIILSACGGQTLDVGSRGGASSAVPSATGGTAAGSFAGNASACPGNLPSFGAAGGSGPAATPPLPEWPDASAGIEGVSGLEGTWNGHVLGLTVPDFTVTLHTGGELPTGTLSFGPPETFPEPTDPLLAPPGLPFTPALQRGFVYTLLDATLVNDRIGFTISWAEPWRRWCQLQKPYCDEHYGGFYCVERSETACVNWDESKQILYGAFSCAQAALCLNNIRGPYTTCDCDANACDAAQRSDFGVEFFLQGGAALGAMGQYTIQLTRG